MKIGIDASGMYGWRGPSRNIRNIIRSVVEYDTNNLYLLFTDKQPDLVLNNCNNYQWVLVKKRKAIPWLNVSLPLSVIAHNVDLFIFPQANFWLWKPVKTIVFTRAAKIEAWFPSVVDRCQAYLQRIRFNTIADKICAVSHFNATQIQLSCLVEPHKFTVINNGVDPIFLDASIRSSTQYGKYILFTGGTEPRKNIHNLLQAFQRLAVQVPDVSLVLVGGKYAPSEPDQIEYAKLIEKLNIKDRVMLYGVEKDTKKLASLYRGSLMTIYPSLQEDFGMVSIEAMACGSPLVASNAPSIPEIAGDAAIYFDPYDVEDMAKKIEMVIENVSLRNELIAKGYERVKKYTWESSAIKIVKVITDVVNSK